MLLCPICRFTGRRRRSFKSVMWMGVLLKYLGMLSSNTCSCSIRTSKNYGYIDCASRHVVGLCSRVDNVVNGLLYNPQSNESVVLITKKRILDETRKRERSWMQNIEPPQRATWEGKARFIEETITSTFSWSDRQMPKGGHWETPA